MKKGAAKPERPPVKQVKDAVVRFRIPVDQKVALNDAATRDGLDLSSWVRRLVLREAGLLPAARKSG